MIIVKNHTVAAGSPVRENTALEAEKNGDHDSESSEYECRRLRIEYEEKYQNDRNREGENHTHLFSPRNERDSASRPFLYGRIVQPCRQRIK